MKWYGYFLAITVVGILVTGCMSHQGQPDNTASGALAGGATGAIIGSMARLRDLGRLSAEWWELWQAVPSGMVWIRPRMRS